MPQHTRISFRYIQSETYATMHSVAYRFVVYRAKHMPQHTRISFRYIQNETYATTHSRIVSLYTELRMCHNTVAYRFVFNSYLLSYVAENQ